MGRGRDLKKILPSPVGIETIGRIDVVLLSHQQHFDNLDNSGRAILPKAGLVLTHPESAKALGPIAKGLKSWESVEIENAAGEQLKITATPAVHGPNDEVRKATGETTGFVLEWEDQKDGALLISGDTVWFDGIQEIGQKFDINTGILHMGAANVPAAGDFRLTMDAAEGSKLSKELGLKAILPAHFEGWMHFKEGRKPLGSKFQEEGLGQQLRLMQPGDRITLDL